MTLTIALALWLILAVVNAMRYHVDADVSEFELKRRIELNDMAARELQEYHTQIPLLESLRIVVVTLVGVLMVTTLVVGYGPLTGIVIGAAGLLLSPLLQRWPIICEWADKLADISRPFALRAVHAIAPALRWLRDRDLANDERKVYSTDELLDVLDRSGGVLSKDQMARLRANLAFDDKTVADVMTPRSMIDTADVKDSVGPLVLDDLHKTGHSRFPVIDGDIDHVVGMLYLHNLIDLKSGHKTVKSAMNPKVYYIHQDKDLEHALHAFLRTHHHLFVVVNDYRETVGLLSLEDALETLLGKKIIDEFDQFDDLRAVAESNPRKNNSHPKAQDV
jgi:CBS domain containing-hemolysin-like protein